MFRAVPNEDIPTDYGILIVDGKVVFAGHLGALYNRPWPADKGVLHMSPEDFKSFAQFLKNDLN